MVTVVTGSEGFIGTRLVKLLKSQKREDEQITCVDLRPNATRTTAVVDVADPELYLRYGPAHCQTIYHLAARARVAPSFADPRGYFRVNVIGTLNMLELARKTGASLVYAGSSSADDEDGSPYSKSKAMGEQLCRHYAKVFGVRAMICRFYNVYGPGSDTGSPYNSVVTVFERQRKAGKPLTVTGSGNQRRDFTHVDDICRGLVAANQRGEPGMTYHLGTGKNWSVNEVASMFRSPAGIVHVEPRPGERDASLAPAWEAEEFLGWKAQVSLPDYVAEFLGNLGVS